MVMTLRNRVALFAVGLALSFTFACASAPAALDMAIGARSTVQSGAIADCSAKAKSALNSVLQNAFEAGEGTGQWLAYGAPDSAGNSSAAATIHCFPVNAGYIATFSCAVQVPPNPDTATALCTKLIAAFGSGTTASTGAHASGGRP